MHVDDLDISPSKLDQSAQVPIDPAVRRAIERAVREARDRQHAIVTRDHLLLGIALTDRTAFASAVEGPGDRVLSAVRRRLAEMPPRQNPERRLDVAVSIDLARTLRAIADRVEGRRLRAEDCVAALLSGADQPASGAPPMAVRSAAPEPPPRVGAWPPAEVVLGAIALACTTAVVLVKAEPLVGAVWSFALATVVLVLARRRTTR